MIRGSMLLGFCVLGLALLVGTSESQEKKKANLPPGFKELKLTATQDEKVREVSADYAAKIADLTKKLTELRAEKLRAELAVLTEEQRAQFIKNKTGGEGKKKTEKKTTDK